MMGGSHPAYEYTVKALSAGKNVITSNKEVVASFGDEFVKLAYENGVSYRFEAAVGGGIPVINPLLGCVRQNKIKEVRGILNGIDYEYYNPAKDPAIAQALREAGF